MTATDRLTRVARPASRMLPSDAMFWYAEEASPALRPLVAGMFLLDRAPDRGGLRRALQRWLVRLPRLRQRVVEAPLRLGLPEWEDDVHFDLDYHLREIALPAPAGDRELFDFVGAVFATPLDHLRPLWEAYAIEGLAGDRAAVFLKVHHCVMDGVGSMAGFEALTQRHRAEPIHVPRTALARPPRSAVERSSRLLRDAWREAIGAAGTVAGFVSQGIQEPGRSVDAMMRTMRGIRGMLRDMNAPTIHDPLADPGTGIGRRLDGMTLPLPRLRRIKEALGVTLNDVILTAVAGAVGRYHEHRAVHLRTLNCQVPMNLRQDHERHALGNRVGAFNVALPVGEVDPLKRLSLITRQTNAAKHDQRGAAVPLLLRALPLIPSFAMRAVAEAATAKINLICTNVPGPPETRYLAGAKVEAIYPFAAITIGLPMVIAFLSYADKFGVGIDTDPAAIPDPELLHRCLEKEIDELEARALPPTRSQAHAESTRQNQRATS